MSDDDKPEKPERPEKPTYTGSRSERLKAAKYAAEAKDRESAQLRDQYADLDAKVEQMKEALSRARPQPVPAIVWSDLSDDEWATQMEGLRGWLRTVLFPRFPSDAAVLKPGSGHAPCWDRHPFVIEALTVGWQTHAAAWSAGAEPAARAQWMGMWRPNMREQVRSELAECKAEGHGNRYLPDPSIIDGHPEETT